MSQMQVQDAMVRKLGTLHRSLMTVRECLMDLAGDKPSPMVQVYVYEATRRLEDVGHRAHDIVGVRVATSAENAEAAAEVAGNVDGAAKRADAALLDAVCKEAKAGEQPVEPGKPELHLAPEV